MFVDRAYFHRAFWAVAQTERGTPRVPLAPVCVGFRRTRLQVCTSTWRSSLWFHSNVNCALRVLDAFERPSSRQGSPGVLSSHPKPSVEQETSKVCQKRFVRSLGDQISTIVTMGFELAATLVCFSWAGCGYRRMYRRMHWAKTNCAEMPHFSTGLIRAAR